jgi:carboxyl-terminal processing protease
MRYDDTTQDGSATPPGEPAGWSTAAGSEAEAAAGGQSGGDSAGPAESATEAPAVPAPTSAPLPTQPSPWPPQPIVWNGSDGNPWAPPPGGPSQWQAPQPPPAPPAWQGPPQPPAPPAWQPNPGWQQGQSWPPQPGWQPYPPPRPFGYPSQPPAGDVSSRHRSRLPQFLVVIAACMIAFSGGMVTDHFGFPNTTSQNGQPGTAAAASGANSDYALYSEALQIVKQDFVGRASVTDQQLLYGAIAGMVDSLGDTGHSTFLTPAEYAAFEASLSASVAGIGVLLSGNNGVFTVDKVIAGSPAAASGVKAGDQITAVNGVSTATITFDQLGAEIRGTAGTKVTISVIHLGTTTPVDITITRANVVVPLVGWGIVPGTHIADIALSEFSSSASDEVQAAIAAAQKAGATSIILDLRGNPGGYASEAQEVASEFMSSGVVYIQQDANGNDTDIDVDPKQTHTNLPLVVLVDHDSASSSEIVAGALQDSGRAKIVGVATFGTGTVLQQFTLSDGSVIFLGTAWWLTPNGHRIFGVGITPNQIVAMPANVLPIDPTTLGAMTTSQLNSSGDAELLAAVKDLGN